MKNRITGLLVGAAGLFSAAFFALSGASCSQPPINCIVMHAPYFAKYTKISGDDNCYPAATTGEDLGMATYLEGDGGKANYQDRSIAIVSTTMGDLFQKYSGLPTFADPNTLSITEADKFYGFSDYTNLPDGNNVCFAFGNGANVISVSEIDAPETDTGEIDEMTMMPITLPAVHYKQEFKNVKIYVTADVPGQQAVGLMHFEDLTTGCQADYSFVAIAPSVGCEGVDEVTGEPNGMPDKEACNPKADPDKGRVFGSGINPAFTTITCDPQTLHCLLADEGQYLTGRPQ